MIKFLLLFPLLLIGCNPAQKTVVADVEKVVIDTETIVQDAEKLGSDFKNVATAV